MIRTIALCGTVLFFTSCDVRKHDKIAVDKTLTQQVEIKDPTTVQIIDST